MFNFTKIKPLTGLYRAWTKTPFKHDFGFWVADFRLWKCRKFSISSGYIRKIPLNPPLQKGEAVGMPGIIEMLQNVSWTYRNPSTIYSVMIVFYVQDTYKLFKFYLIYGKVVDKLGNLSYYLLTFSKQRKGKVAERWWRKATGLKPKGHDRRVTDG